jgi:hypothetical protein
MASIETSLGSLSDIFEDAELGDVDKSVEADMSADEFAGKLKIATIDEVIPDEPIVVPTPTNELSSILTLKSPMIPKTSRGEKPSPAKCHQSKRIVYPPMRREPITSAEIEAAISKMRPAIPFPEDPMFLPSRTVPPEEAFPFNPAILDKLFTRIDFDNTKRISPDDLEVQERTYCICLFLFH